LKVFFLLGFHKLIAAGTVFRRTSSQVEVIDVYCGRCAKC